MKYQTKPRQGASETCAHIAHPNWYTLCGLPPMLSAVAYDDVSLDRSPGWCEECCRKYLLPSISEEDENELFSVGILGLSQDMMMSLSGAADPIEPARAERMKAYLEFRLMTWRPSTLHKAYDDAARARVLAVLEALDAVGVTHG